MPDEPTLDRDKLGSRFTRLREEERSLHQRQAELDAILAERAHTEDEAAEIGEIGEQLTANADHQRAIQRSLERGPYSPAVNEDVGLSRKERENYSLVRLIRGLANGASRSDRDAATLELEASAEIERKTGDAPRGVYLPREIIGRRLSPQSREVRDLLADDYGQGGALVGVDFRPQDLIPLLRNMTVVMQLGARFIGDLIGDFAIPKQTAAGTAAWVPKDGGTVGETQQTTSQVTMTPHTLGCYVDWTRQLRLQSSVDIEMFIRDDLERIIAIEEDRAALHGSGVGGEPLGVENVTGIGSVAFGASGNPTRNEIIALRREVALDNALMGNLGFVTEPTTYSNMMARTVDPGSGRFLLDENGMLLARPCLETNQLADNHVIFGNWADMIVGQWGGYDLLVDPFSRSTAGVTRMVVFKTCDVVIRHAESFAVGS